MSEEQTSQLHSTLTAGGQQEGHLQQQEGHLWQQEGHLWQQGLISIIVPVYNIRDYLERCVNSILAQTYRQIEVILVDDGSNDGSGELCDTLAQKDSRIRVIHQANGGSSAARNHGIGESHGEFLGFVDSDDYIAPDMYEKMYVAAYGSYTARQDDNVVNPAPKYHIIQIARDEIAEDGTILPDICIPPEKPTEYTAEAFLREMLLHRGDASMCTKLIQRDLLGDHRFPEGKLNEDFRILVEILSEISTVEDNEEILKESGMDPDISGENGGQVKGACSEKMPPGKTAVPGVILALPDRGYHVFYKSGSNSRTDKTKFSRVFSDNVENADYVEQVVADKYTGLIPVARRFALYQRLEYLLHIPVRQMTRENAEYQNVVRYVKDHKRDIQTVPELTKKNRTYLKIFAICNPRTVRYLHAKLKGFDI